ncbi:MAG: hypothetical protein WBK51_12650 [Polaromonas sp.]
MSAVIIEHVNIADLPPSWRAKLADAAGQVTVRIETEQAPANDIMVHHTDPAFCMWADRADLTDPAAYAQKLRDPRYNSSGLRNGV